VVRRSKLERMTLLDLQRNKVRSDRIPESAGAVDADAGNVVKSVSAKPRVDRGLEGSYQERRGKSLSPK
jgi:hypothetical protein